LWLTSCSVIAMLDHTAWRWLAIISVLVASAGTAIASEASAKAGTVSQPKPRSRTALLQVRHGSTNGVSPEFLEDSTAVPSPGSERAEAEAGTAKKPLAAVQSAKASAVHVQASGSDRPAHRMQLLSGKDKDKTEVLPSVRLEQAGAAAEQVLSLFAAGAKAAIKNAVPSETLGWLSSTASEAASEQGPASTSRHASDALGLHPGAMRFFSDSKRAGASRAPGQLQKTLLAALDTGAHKPEPASMMAMGMASILKGDRGGAAQPERSADVPAAAREPLMPQQQQAQLAFIQQLEAQQKEEASHAKELEQQRQLEEAMDSAREAARWG